MIEMQKISLEQLEKDYTNLAYSKTSSPVQLDAFKNHAASDNVVRNKLEKIAHSNLDYDTYVNNAHIDKPSFSQKSSVQLSSSPQQDQRSSYQKYLEEQQIQSKNRSLSQGNHRDQMEFGTKSQNNFTNHKTQRKPSNARNQESCMGSIMSWDEPQPKLKYKKVDYKETNSFSIPHEMMKFVRGSDNNPPQASSVKNYANETKNEFSYEKSKKMLQDTSVSLTKVTFPSNQKQLNENKQISELEIILSNLNQKKQNLENEITKFPTMGGRSLKDIKHRREVEENLQQTEANISNVKRKLRDLGAL